LAPALTYCTNLFPSETLADVRAAVEKFYVALGPATGSKLNLGLYLSARAAKELEAPETMAQFESHLTSLNVNILTVNAFPYGGFHGSRVQEEVFRPTWEDRERHDYTRSVCQHLSRWLPKGVVGSVSTHSGTFKDFGVNDESDDRIRRAWLRAAVDLAHIEEETGKQIVLSIEPEPFSRLETTDEVLLFFDKLLTTSLHRSAAEWSVHSAWLERAARRHLGVCFDVCHQAVEFEDCVNAIARLRAAGIPIGKIQASCAPALTNPGQAPAAVAALGRFAEPRYLHQTFGRTAAGAIQGKKNLTDALADAAFVGSSEEIRTHFHVPIHLEDLGDGVKTTRGELTRVLAACADAAPVVEIETYTLPDMPGGAATQSAVMLTIQKEWEFARGILGA
jgi:sugar phosphate isomerase/epimerase